MLDSWIILEYMKSVPKIGPAHRVSMDRAFDDLGYLDRGRFVSDLRQLLPTEDWKPGRNFISAEGDSLLCLGEYPIVGLRETREITIDVYKQWLKHHEVRDPDGSTPKGGTQ